MNTLLGNGLTLKETIKLHNEPNWGGLPACECPICRPDLNTTTDTATCACTECPTCHAMTVCPSCYCCARCSDHATSCTGCPMSYTVDPVPTKADLVEAIEQFQKRD